MKHTHKSYSHPVLFLSCWMCGDNINPVHMPLIRNLYMQWLNFLIYKFELHVTRIWRGGSKTNTDSMVEIMLDCGLCVSVQSWFHFVWHRIWLRGGIHSLLWNMISGVALTLIPFAKFWLCQRRNNCAGLEHKICCTEHQCITTWQPGPFYRM